MQSFNSYFTPCSGTVLNRCLSVSSFLFFLEHQKKTMWKSWSHSMSLNNIQTVSVTGRYLITQQRGYKTGKLTTFHYTSLVSVLGRYNLIGSFQQNHQNTTHSTQKLTSFKLTILHAMQLFSNIQKCHSLCMPCKDYWRTCAVPHTTTFSVTTKHHNHHK